MKKIATLFSIESILLCLLISEYISIESFKINSIVMYILFICYEMDILIKNVQNANEISKFNYVLLGIIVILINVTILM